MATLNLVTISAMVVGMGAIAAIALHTHGTAREEHLIAPQPYFPSEAIWNQDVSHAQVDPRSDAIVQWLADSGGWGLGRMQIDFSLRVNQATDHTPSVRFRPSPNWMAADSDHVSEIPLPVGGGVEGQPGYACRVGEDDCHLIVADRPHGKLYEAWQANYVDHVLTADSLVVWDLQRVYPPSGRGDQCTSADAAGFPIAPLLFNADELAIGSINHAIRFILPNRRMRAKVFVHPATHAGAPAGPESAPPLGAHFRLKRTFDISRLKPPARVVARALQKYGMFLSDGGSITLTAQSDRDTTTKYVDLQFGPHDMEALKVTDFEILTISKPISLTYDCVRNR